ncbi:Cell division cycle protein [Glycine soja]
MERLARSARTWRWHWRSFSSFQTLASRSSPPSSFPKFASSWSTSSSVSSSRVLREDYSLLPVVLAGIFGTGFVEAAYADNGAVDVQESAKKERERIEELLRSRGIRYGSYPRFTVSVKGQKVSIKFQIPPNCEVSQLIANLTAHLGTKAEGHGGGSDMLLRAWDSTVAWQLTLTHPSKLKHIQGNNLSSTDIIADDRDLCILIFHSLIGSDKAEIEFIKQGDLSPEELDAFVSVLQLAGNKLGQRNTLERKPREETEKVPSVDKSISDLEGMGVRIYGLDEPVGISNDGEISWDNIAGYEHQKRVVEDTILLALHSPEVYDDIARGTRHKFESNRPRAVLFEGPPGTGKTSCARVIANQAGVPLLYVPLEAIMSEFYGKSERLLGKVFSLANTLPNGAIIFLDEIDSFAAARDNEMHEATRRILSVLLRQIDGFEQDKKVVVIAATNRKEDLDPALISRFDSMIAFGLPDHQNRQEIASKYAKHLSKPELDELARVTEDMSGRDIRDVCQQAERSWASKIIRGQVPKEGEKAQLPPLQEYIECATSRQEALHSAAANRKFASSFRRRNRISSD